MANEITFGNLTGKTLTYGAYQPDGSVRTAAGTALTEVAGTGYYKASDANIIAGDFVVIREGAVEVGQGQYKPEVSATGISGDITDIASDITAILEDTGTTLPSTLTTIEDKIDTLTTQQSQTYNITDETQKPPSLQITIE
jgi:hypothetical protein